MFHLVIRWGCRRDLTSALAEVDRKQIDNHLTTMKSTLPKSTEKRATITAFLHRLLDHVTSSCYLIMLLVHATSFARTQIFSLRGLLWSCYFIMLLDHIAWSWYLIMLLQFPNLFMLHAVGLACANVRIQPSDVTLVERWGGGCEVLIWFGFWW